MKSFNTVFSVVERRGAVLGKTLNESTSVGSQQCFRKTEHFFFFLSFFLVEMKCNSWSSFTCRLKSIVESVSRCKKNFYHCCFGLS